MSPRHAKCHVRTPVSSLEPWFQSQFCRDPLCAPGPALSLEIGPGFPVTPRGFSSHVKRCTHEVHLDSWCRRQVVTLQKAPLGYQDHTFRGRVESICEECLGIHPFLPFACMKCVCRCILGCQPPSPLCLPLWVRTFLHTHTSLLRTSASHSDVRVQGVSHNQRGQCLAQCHTARGGRTVA